MLNQVEARRARERSADSVEALIDGTWKLNHCRARIRLLTGYCMFLTKRAYYYKSEVRKAGLIDFVKSQYQEMLTYKMQLIELETRAERNTQVCSLEARKEINLLSEQLSEKINHRFHAIAAKVSEKVPGETAANAFEITDDEIAKLLEDELGDLRSW